MLYVVLAIGCAGMIYGGIGLFKAFIEFCLYMDKLEKRLKSLENHSDDKEGK